VPIRFACPKCQTAYTAHDRDAGKKSECKTCGQRLEVPAPLRSKTVLGQILPETRGPIPVPSSPPIPVGRLEPTAEPIPLQPSSPAPAVPAGPIRFDCPTCQTSYTVNRASAGKSMTCRTCGQAMVVPGSSGPREAAPRHAALPVARAVEPENMPDNAPDNANDYGPTLVADPFPVWRPGSRYPNATANRILAGVGTGLVFIALFLPMVNGPFGFWMSFIDMPWKAVTVGSAIADEITDERREPAPAPRQERRKNDREDSGKAAKAGLVVVVAILSVVYPLFVLALLGFSTFQIASGRTARGYFLAGLLIGAATVSYAVAILLLNAVPEMRVVMLVISPGFGWAVLLVGSVLLMASGLMRREA
jgi:transcription elongation factor Elf1